MVRWDDGDSVGHTDGCGLGLRALGALYVHGHAKHFDCASLLHCKREGRNDVGLEAWKGADTRWSAHVPLV